jgi:hypothetical protein
VSGVDAAALNAWFASIKSRLDLQDAGLELLIARVEALEGEREAEPSVPPSEDVLVRLPKFKLRDINARLEGGDVE